MGKKQWQALKALADSLDRTAAQLVREAIDLLLKKYGDVKRTSKYPRGGMDSSSAIH